MSQGFSSGKVVGSGSVLQIATAIDNTYSQHINAQIPYDDTIPQSSQGSELITVDIEPHLSNSLLVVEFNAPTMLIGVGTEIPTYTLFRDADADAILTGHSALTTGTLLGSMHFRHRVVADSKDLTTFKVRVGGNLSTSDIYFNGDTSARKYGGSSVILLTVIEIAQ